MNKCNKCGKIFVPIPGDDRDESFCLRCERNELKAKLECVTKDRDEWKDGAAFAVEEHNKLKEELERLQKQTAEMGDALRRLREAIVRLGELTGNGITYFDESPTITVEAAKRWIALNDAGKLADQVLSSTNGAGYLSPAEVRDAVKPLVEFVERCVEDWSCDVDHDGDHPPDCRHCAALDLLSQAKAKGWVP